MVDVPRGDLRIYGLADRIVTVEALAATLDRAGPDVVDVQFVVVVAERR